MAKAERTIPRIFNNAADAICERHNHPHKRSDTRFDALVVLAIISVVIAEITLGKNHYSNTSIQNKTTDPIGQPTLVK